MIRIRRIEPDDLPRVGSLYAELEQWRGEEMPGYLDFFRRVLFEVPGAEPELASLVCEDSDAGLIGFIASHPRRFQLDGKPIRAVCFGPLIIDRRHRRKGLAGRLLRHLLGGSQEMTFNDRSIEQVHGIWSRLGSTTDSVASIGWVRLLAPAGRLVDRASRGRIARGIVPGGAALARADAIGAPRRNPRPGAGTARDLMPADQIDLLARLDPVFRLRPAYDELFLEWLFETMAMVDLGGNVLRRLVVGDDGAPLGSYVAVARKHGHAYVMQIAAPAEHVGLVLDHLIHDAAAVGAVTLQGRVEPFLLPHLETRRCRLEPADWAGVQSEDQALVGAVLAGRSLVTRMDGEWWMRPAPLVRR